MPLIMVICCHYKILAYENNFYQSIFYNFNKLANLKYKVKLENITNTFHLSYEDSYLFGFYYN